MQNKASDVSIVFRFFPLPMHSWARKAAEYAACAQLQSNEGFWEVHDALFEYQSAISNNNLESTIARNASALKFPLLRSCVAEGRTKEMVNRDIHLGEELNVQGTPSIFINHIRVQGRADDDRIRTILAQVRSQIKSFTAVEAYPTVQSN